MLLYISVKVFLLTIKKRARKKPGGREFLHHMTSIINDMDQDNYVFKDSEYNGMSMNFIKAKKYGIQIKVYK